jgi:hypothetical protein
MPKGPSKNAATIERLLEERRQYEAWLARLNSAANATPEPVRVRVGADYAARLKAVNEELKIHAEAAANLVAQRREHHTDLVRKERAAAERLSEAELRHAVGEYDEGQWTQVHKDVLAELVSVREELQAVQAEIAQLEELNTLVISKGSAAVQPHPPRAGPPPRPREPATGDASHNSAPPRRGQVDELAFLKSVTEDEKGPSPRRASGAQYQPSELTSSGSRRASPPVANPSPAPIVPAEEGAGEAVKVLKCQECGTMNLPTEWYCEQCGAELAAL